MVLVLCSLIPVKKLIAKEFVIGVEAVSYYPLFDYAHQQVDKPSFSSAVLTKFFQSKGYKFRFLPLPIKRFNKWFIEENIDFKFPDNQRWRTAKNDQLAVHYSAPVITLTAGSYVLKRNKQLARNKVKSLATIFGFFPTLWYDRINQGKLTVVTENTPYAVVKHLLHGNVEVVNIDYNVILHNLKLHNMPEDSVVLNRQIHHENYAYHLSSINYPNIIDEFNQFLADNKLLIAQLKAEFNIQEFD